MKTVCVLGSPRVRGNSAALAKRYCETAERLGSEIQTFTLNTLNYRGCQACMTCKTKLDKCVLEDDLTGVLDAIREADVLVITTPVYFGEVSGQFKQFIDRTFSYAAADNSSRLSPGKKLVFIQTQAEPDQSKFADIFPRYESAFKWYGFAETYLIQGCGVYDKGEAEAREDLMKLAGETAEKVMA